MQIKISTRHGTIAEVTRSRMTARVEKLTRLFDRLTAIEVTVDLERRDAPLVVLKVSAEHNNSLAATTRADELMAALDVAIHKVEQQLRKYKERIQERHRNPDHRKQQMPTEREAGGE